MVRNLRQTAVRSCENQLKPHTLKIGLRSTHPGESPQEVVNVNVGLFSIHVRPNLQEVLFQRENTG